MTISLKIISAWVSTILLLLMREDTTANGYAVDKTAKPGLENASSNNTVDLSANQGHIMSLETNNATVESRSIHESLKHFLFSKLTFSNHTIGRRPCIKGNCSSYVDKSIAENETTNVGKETVNVVRATAGLDKDLTASGYNGNYLWGRVRRGAETIDSVVENRTADLHVQHKREADTTYTSSEVLHSNVTSSIDNGQILDANITEDTANVTANAAETLNASVWTVPDEGAEDTSTGNNNRCPTLNSCSSGCPNMSLYRECDLVNVISLCPWSYHWNTDQPDKLVAKCLTQKPCYVTADLLIFQEFKVDGVPVACVATLKPMMIAAAGPLVG